MAWRVEHRDVVESTNDEVRARAEVGEPEGLVIVAREQRAGRGRRGRAWASPAGGLYASVLLRPRLPPAAAGRVPIAAGLAVARVVASLGLKPELRWPNDVLLPQGKVAGVLCEARLGVSGQGWVVVGFGINVAEDSSLAGLGGASLDLAVGRPIPVPEVLRRLLSEIEKTVADAELRPAVLTSEWMAHAPMMDRELLLKTEQGEVRGHARRLADDGALVVDVQGEQVRITDPDLVILREIA